MTEKPTEAELALERIYKHHRTVIVRAILAPGGRVIGPVPGPDTERDYEVIRAALRAAIRAALPPLPEEKKP